MCRPSYESATQSPTSPAAHSIVERLAAMALRPLAMGLRSLAPVGLDREATAELVARRVEEALRSSASGSLAEALRGATQRAWRMQAAAIGGQPPDWFDALDAAPQRRVSAEERAVAGRDLAEGLALGWLTGGLRAEVTARLVADSADSAMAPYASDWDHVAAIADQLRGFGCGALAKALSSQQRHDLPPLIARLVRHSLYSSLGVAPQDMGDDQPQRIVPERLTVASACRAAAAEREDGPAMETLDREVRSYWGPRLVGLLGEERHDVLRAKQRLEAWQVNAGRRLGQLASERERWSTLAKAGDAVGCLAELEQLGQGPRDRSLRAAIASVLRSAISGSVLQEPMRAAYLRLRTRQQQRDDGRQSITIRRYLCSLGASLRGSAVFATLAIWLACFVLFATLAGGPHLWSTLGRGLFFAGVPAGLSGLLLASARYGSRPTARQVAAAVSRRAVVVAFLLVGLSECLLRFHVAANFTPGGFLFLQLLGVVLGPWLALASWEWPRLQRQVSAWGWQHGPLPETLQDVCVDRLSSQGSYNERF